MPGPDEFLARPELRCGDYRLVLAPEIGGAVVRFDWREEPLFRPMLEDHILNAGCFPLVPFANRIVRGRFFAGHREVQLRPTLPQDDPVNALHGYGWISAWDLAECTSNRATLVHHYEPGDWLWPYRAEQCFDLTEAGLTITLSVQNLGDAAMPAGLGLHPFFPRIPDARYLGLHAGEWQSGPDGLPISLEQGDQPRDWWGGLPITSRTVDTVYARRSGNLRIQWPERGIELNVSPDPQLDHTAVYVPAGADFFCVEPMTHATDAINRGGMLWLEPGECLAVSVKFAASELR